MGHLMGPFGSLIPMWFLVGFIFIAHDTKVSFWKKAYLNGGLPFFLNILEFALVSLLMWIVDSIPFSLDRRISPLPQLLL